MFNTTTTTINGSPFEMVIRYASFNQPDNATQIIRRHLFEINARQFGSIDEFGVELWAFENRVFIVHTVDGFCRLFTAEFETLSQAIAEIESFCQTNFSI
jgi:hypothetical protein